MDETITDLINRDETVFLLMTFTSKTWEEETSGLRLLLSKAKCRQFKSQSAQQNLGNKTPFLAHLGPDNQKKYQNDKKYF